MSTYNISINQGATYRLLITIKDPDENPIDLTGFTFRGMVRATTSDSKVQATFTFDVKDQVTNTGQVEAILTADQTAGIELPKQTNPHRKITTMVYDIESENLAGEVIRWLEGSALVSPEVTR